MRWYTDLQRVEHSQRHPGDEGRFGELPAGAAHGRFGTALGLRDISLRNTDMTAAVTRRRLLPPPPPPWVAQPSTSTTNPHHHRHPHVLVTAYFFSTLPECLFFCVCNAESIIPLISPVFGA